MIFIDTGAFLARYIERDQFHRPALRIWQELGTGSEQCFTSNLVLAETLTLLGRRAGYIFAAETARSIYTSSILRVLRPDLEHELNALIFFRKFADQRASFTDCVSFALMRSHRIRRAFSFDRHFSLLGFELLD